MTVSVTVKVPAEPNVWLGLCAELPDVPSPHVQLYVYGVVPPDTVGVKETDSPTDGCAGVNAKLTVSAGFTVIEFVRVPTPPVEFVTLSVTSRVPAVEYAWVTFCVVP
ncbi:MAG TPA: hypothetical protein VIL58_09725 [Thermoplasmata archaeon]